MRKFLAKHAAATTGTLSCFDRLLFKGHLPLGYPHAMEVFLTLRGVLFKDLKAFVLKQADRLKAHAQTMAARAGRPYEYFESPVRKDQLAGRARPLRRPGQSAPARRAQGLSLLLGHLPGRVRDRRPVHEPRRPARALRAAPAARHAVSAGRGRAHLPRPQAPRRLHGRDPQRVEAPLARGPREALDEG